MDRRVFGWLAAALLWSPGGPAFAAQPGDTPDAVIRQMSQELIAVSRTDKALQAGDSRRMMSLIDTRIMPNVNFQRMTAAAVGPAWRQASAQQRQHLQEEFKTLLVRTYAGALPQLKDRTIVVQPPRAGAADGDAIVRCEVRGGGEPMELAYRMERASDGGWRIYNLNVLGIWLVDTYRNQFGPEISAHGIDGLIQALHERNAGAANAS